MLRALAATIFASLSFAACILPREGGLDDSPDGSDGGAATGLGGSGTGAPVGGSGTGAPEGGSGTGTHTGTNTGMPGPEDCQDGIDNDGDMQVDCADPDCTTGYTCAPAPTDWSVPSYVAMGGFPGPAVTCPDATPPEVLFEGPGEPASCAACACDGSGLGCSSPTVSCWYDTTTCSGNPSLTVSPNTCENIANCSGTCNDQHRCQQVTNSQLTGQCAPSGGTATVGPMWKGEASLCPSPTQGGGCNAGEVCVPVAPAEFGADLCVRRDGDQACPSGYPNGILAFAGGTDTRACSSCGCNEGTVSCTAGSSAVHTDDGCVGSSVALNGCTDVTSPFDGPDASIAVTPGTLAGACTPTGGQPTGSVMPSGPVTVCCP